ncbi:MAG TPA: helix-turn-helix transcriptional regulator [Thermoanaerobaculia bacterium]|nr:helix-turn-helix transcriptional regulator [Thermoanaerobaculia bacterium]
MNSELLTVLDQAIRLSDKSRRAIERELGMSQGYLNSIFKGRIQLRVSHVKDIARVLGVEPSSLFLQAFPPKDPGELLKQLGISPTSTLRIPAALLGALGPDELQKAIREVVRDEMARLSGTPESRDDRS